MSFVERPLLAVGAGEQGFFVEHDTQVNRRRSVFIGMMLGIGFGVWDLLSSLLDPLADDAIPVLLTFTDRCSRSRT